MFRIHSFPNNDTSNSSTQLHLPLLKTTYHNCLMNYLSISNVGLAAGLMLWMLNPKSSLILFLHLASFNSIVQQLALIPFTLHRHACSRMPGQYTTSVMNMQPMHSDQQSFFGGRLIGCKRAFNIAIFWSRDLAGTWKSINRSASVGSCLVITSIPTSRKPMPRKVRESSLICWSRVSRNLCGISVQWHRGFAWWTIWKPSLKLFWLSGVSTTLYARPKLLRGLLGSTNMCWDQLPNMRISEVRQKGTMNTQVVATGLNLNRVYTVDRYVMEEARQCVINS
mmetsp:Transcript_47299/g.90286  ORF Transcript_47299/g.90286 Transcript_47299/m.90286 type:complete len:281 (+) Transcript_47299:1107-1949(+)